MKKIIILVAFMVTTLSQRTFSQSSVKQSMLSGYYKIKDALVSSDANAAAAAAREFLKVSTGADLNALTAEEAAAIKGCTVILNFDARHISESKDIAHQREHFASLSQSFFKLAKSVKLTDQPGYYDYCPMNRTYWLSADQAIKNPYYGKQMLTCGSIKDSL